MTPRQKEKQRLIAQKENLHRQYPNYPAGLPNNKEPEEILRHCREVIRFNCKSHAEYREVSFP